ncbi:MAG: ATP-dependent zinc metalloprotease FtsH [Eubacteriales bacterium]
MGLVTMILWCLILTLLIRSCVSSQQNMGTIYIGYSQLYEMIEAGQISEVAMENGKYTITLVSGVSVDSEGVITDLRSAEESTQGGSLDLDLSLEGDLEEPQEPETSQGTTSTGGTFGSFLSPDTSGEPTYVTIPPFFYDEDILKTLREHQIYHDFPEVDMSQYYLSLVFGSVVPFFLIMGIMYLIFRSAASKGGFGGMGGVGKSNAKVYVEKTTGVTFANVAGQDEAKESLQEIIDILHNPTKYTEIGAKLPKGALLVGPPGTGKTLLAKAVAGEAGVPFFSISGSDFVEMFVGVGASRVRDLFKEAHKMAPCIVFIDEIDTIGKSRDGRNGGGGNDEREQTLNQLLAELDGFDPSKGVIVLGATNRPEVLDKALLRPGRFDRRITIDRPNLAGRLTTLQVHTKNIHLAEDVDLNKIALATAGTVGADLANLVNEAALRAVRNGRKAVNQEDLLASFEFVIAGSEKKNSVLTEFEKKLVAYHEVGHAMVAYKQKNSEPVQKITIVPHTEGSLGYTLLMPEEDKTSLRTKDELMAKIAVSMGGRAAEELVLNVQSNGAAQDIQDATSTARSMVALYGMSEEFGMMALASVRNQYLDGGYGIDCADTTSAQIDRAVMAILKSSFDTAMKVLSENREDMDKVVAYLLEKETITGAEMVAIIEGRDPSTADGAYASTRSGESKPLSLENVKVEDVTSKEKEAVKEDSKESFRPFLETPVTYIQGKDESWDNDADSGYVDLEGQISFQDYDEDGGFETTITLPSVVEEEKKEEPSKTSPDYSEEEAEQLWKDKD